MKIFLKLLLTVMAQLPPRIMKLIAPDGSLTPALSRRERGIQGGARFATLSLMLLLSGCAGLDTLKDAYDGIGEYFGGKDNAEPPKELAKEAPAERKFNTLWKAQIGKGYAEQHINLAASLNEDSVFAADRKGEVFRLNKQNGEKIWSIDTSLPFSAGPTVYKDKVVLGTSNAEVVAYNTADGALLWKSAVSSEILAKPAVQRGTIVVRGSDGHLTALDEKTGTLLWTYERTPPPLSVRSQGAPTLVDDLVIDGYVSGKLIALRLKDGKVEWEATIALPHGRSEIERLVNVDAIPVIRNDTLYVSGYQGGIAAVSARDGEVLWREEKLFTSSALAANRRSLFLADVTSDVWQVDMRNGGNLWKQDALHQRRLTAPAIIKGFLIVGDFEGYVHALSQEDGHLMARIQIDDGAIETSPIVSEDVIYIYSSDGKLTALTLE